MNILKIMSGNQSSFWSVSVSRFTFILALACLVLYHLPLFLFTSDNLDILTTHGLLTTFIVSLIIFTFTSVALFLLFIISRWVALPIVMIMFFLNSAAVYFMLTYQVVFDKAIIESIFNTRLIESNGYLHPKLFIYIFLLGVIPTWVASKFRIQKTNRLKLLLHALLTLAFCLCMIYLNASTSLWIDKNASNLGSRILPWSYVINTAKYQHALSDPIVREELPTVTFTDDEKSIVVLVIGETARAQNFSLYGYERETNPLLNKASVVVLNDTTACSTYTTASISCMLSHASSNMGAYETLPTYLNRHDVDVIWHTNNWGESGVSVATYRNKESLKKDCHTDNCDYDEVLLSALKQRIEASDKDKILVVLHTSGSHGPSYYKKYPPAFEVFKPVCKSVVLDQCTPQELINAYDNSLLYTDYFLSQLIGLLKTMPEVPTSMMYVSDHGESLGEYGLYLHGTPYTIAPDFQKKVPFLLWMSDNFMSKKSIFADDFKQEKKHTHRHIFHSVMGGLDAKSEVYDAEFDIFRQNGHDNNF